jgi:uncharacterized protein YbjT (DUF2867 family)
MSSAVVFGSTGLVGSYILSNLLKSDAAFSAIHTISRRAPKGEGEKLQATVETETAQWATKLLAIKPAPTTVFSAVGTTRAQAGGVDAQWKIDHDLNVELTKAARSIPEVKTFVFISSGGTRGFLSASVPYSKMKIGVEDAIKEAGFDTAIILRPGLIMGDREVAHSSGPMLTGMTKAIGRVLGQGVVDKFAQEAEIIGKAAVHAARLAAEGKAPSKYWVLEQNDIVKLGRTEWKD